MSKATYPMEYMAPNQYFKLRSSGMMYEWYPQATGIYTKDVKPKEEEDPAVAKYRAMGEIFVEDSEMKGFILEDIKKQTSNIETSHTPDYYNKVYKGIKLDPYRIADLYGLKDHASFQALKKLLRSGADHKDLRQDLKEAKDAISRKIEMLDEDTQMSSMHGC